MFLRKYLTHRRASGRAQPRWARMRLQNINTVFCQRLETRDKRTRLVLHLISSQAALFSVFFSLLSSFSSTFINVCLFYPVTIEQSKSRQGKEIPPLYKGAFCLSDAVLVTGLFALHCDGESDQCLLWNENSSFLREILVPTIKILNI